jgi:FG-GAP repeat
MARLARGTAAVITGGARLAGRDSQGRAVVLSEGHAQMYGSRAATEPLLRRRRTSGAGAVASRRLLLAASVLAVVVGAVVFEIVVAEHPGSRSAALHYAPVDGLTALPLAAQGVVSSAVGADRAAYRVTASGAGFHAVSAAQGLHMRFESSGVQVRSGNTQIGLSLQAWGYGASLQAIGAVRPRAEANRVTYVHAELSEWYRNGPLGLEQGFTIRHAPAGAQSGPLKLLMGLSSNLSPSLIRSGRGIVFTHRGKTILRYQGLAATDARGRQLHSWLQLQGGLVVLHVDTRGARFPLRIDPFIQQGSKLTEAASPDFGESVALSADGNTALIGASGDNGKIGAAWVFTRSGETWAKQGAKLTAADEVGTGAFGVSVALSADGNTALIGGWADNSHGAAWVFTRSGSTWTQQGAKLTGSGESGSENDFGSSVALSADGNTALIGGFGDNSLRGAAWVFTRSETTWTQQGEKLTGNGEVGAGDFGYSVALSADGNTALISGMNDSNRHGAAWIFTRTGTKWAQQGEKLTGNGEVGEGDFGWSADLSGDGNTALVGGPYDRPSTYPHGVGAAWVFTRSGTTWTQQGEKLTGNGEVGEGDFGCSVSLSGDGNTALIGGPTDDPSNNYGGAAWVLTRSGETWIQQEGSKLAGGEQSQVQGPNYCGARFGATVVLSSDASTALVAGDFGASIGAVWTFVYAQHAPIATTEAASGIGTNSAELNGRINPDGETVTDCHFQYGTSTFYGSSVPCASLPGSGESPVAVYASAVNLLESATYHFRIVATNASGTNYGADKAFSTPRNPPEYGRCIKVSKGKGQFENGGCTKAGGTKVYEWYPGAVRTHFTTTIKELTTATLQPAKGSKVTCLGETGSGEYTGHKTVGGVILTFTRCERLGEKCSTSQAAEGEIVTKPLEGVLGATKLGATSIQNQIGLDLFPVGKTGAVMEFRCGATPVSVRGSVIGVSTENSMKLTSTLIYAASSKGNQKPESFVGLPKDILEASFNEQPFEQTGLILKALLTNEEKVEVNSVF